MCVEQRPYHVGISTEVGLRSTDDSAAVEVRGYFRLPDLLRFLNTLRLVVVGHITSSIKMKLSLVALSCLLLAAANAYEPIELEYHENVGIPKAEAIRQAELAADFDGSRIVGGSTVNSLGEWPFIGGLVITLTDGRTSVCGSSLLSATKLVTAAHCWRTGNAQARQFTVVLGSLRLFSGGTRVNTNRVEMHGSYNMNTLANDIAIITINRVNLNNNINTIALASGNNNYAGTWARAAGFGLTRDDNINTIALASGNNNYAGTWARAAGFGLTRDGEIFNSNSTRFTHLLLIFYLL
ncbi:Collagenase [Papilio machaon]|uniref:Collagenase n=1 Tax=Papilio machaon TaxID=76193 RepID=A0A0N1IB92_PAPMA|nr:Collagenase [Papilio machaon]